MIDFRHSPAAACLGLALAPGLMTVEPASAATTIASPLVVHTNQDRGPATALALDAGAYAALPEAGQVTINGFPLDRETRVDLALERFEILAADARIVAGTASGDVDLPRPDVVLLRGFVVGMPGSTVLLALSPHGSNGLI